MRRENGALILSASDLMRFYSCEHASHLDFRYLNGADLKPVEDSPETALLQEKGDEHEATYLEALKASGKSVVEISREGKSLEETATETVGALATGADIVFQGAFLSTDAGGVRWGGYSDFLEKVSIPSDLGEFSYEVADTKLKRHASPTHVLQLVLYSDLLTAVQGAAPPQMHLILGDRSRVTLTLDEFVAYARHGRDRLEAFLNSPWETRPQPVSACGLCRWRRDCAEHWEATNDLCLVAGSTKSQRTKLEAAGVRTIGEMARRTNPVRGLAADTFSKLRLQAELQDARRKGGDPAFVLKPHEPGRGFDLLPQPAQGDLFFDMEGDPHYPGGLEYLFGVYFLEPDEAITFKAWWAHDREAEGVAAVGILEFFIDHLRRHPDAHIYHYNHYEVTALKRLTSQHSAGEALLDQLLRERRFVDLYRVVQQAIVASEPGYSIKDLEAFYMEKRGEEVATAGESIVAYEKWRESKNSEILQSIEDYNKVDCRSTMLLRNWLVDRARPVDLPWPDLRTETPPPDELAEKRREEEEATATIRQKVDARRCRLGDDLADLLIDLSLFHRRELKPAWWAMFDRAGRDTAELIDDLDSLGGLTALVPAAPEKRSQIRRYQFPPQDTKIRAPAQGVKMREGLVTINVVELDDNQCEAVIKFGPKAGDPPHSLDVIPGGPVPTDIVEIALHRVIDDVLAHDPDDPIGRPAIARFLMRALPRVVGHDGGPLADPAKDVVDELVRVISSLDRSVLPIQGPPGTGKTYGASHAILSLVNAGKRVAASSNSHKAIDNLLIAVADRAREAGAPIRIAKKLAQGEIEAADPMIAGVTNNNDPLLATAPLVGGTAWLFSRAEHDRKFDYLFVDEAGQVSLGNLIALSSCAENIVLVGDPMQLPQPLQGAHPGKSGWSSLEFALNGEHTIPDDRGLFLPESRRMHPDICRVISWLAYDGRLRSHLSTERQAVSSKAAKENFETGVSFVAVPHEGNTQVSDEEVVALRDVYHSYLGGVFRDKDGVEKLISANDILVVAPYNAQVNALRTALPDGARVGTVDKFQGQEAPICLISMATSDADNIPRDVGFLLSLNRLNVAISRAQALAILLASPKLMDIPCGNLDDMRRVSGFCRIVQHDNAI